MKFLPHDLIQGIKSNSYILRKDFFWLFLDEHNKNGSFEWILVEKWHWGYSNDKLALLLNMFALVVDFQMAP